MGYGPHFVLIDRILASSLGRFSSSFYLMRLSSLAGSMGGTGEDGFPPILLEKLPL